MADLQVPLPTLLLRMGSPSPTSSLPWGPGTMPIYPCMAGCGSLPAYGIVQASQSHPPLGTSGTFPLVTTKSASYSLWLCAVFQTTAPMRPCGAQCPFLLGWSKCD